MSTMQKDLAFDVREINIINWARRITHTCCAATAGVMGAKVPDVQPCSRMAALLVADLRQMHTSCLALALAIAAVPVPQQAVNMMAPVACCNPQTNACVCGDMHDRPLAGVCKPRGIIHQQTVLQAQSTTHLNRSYQFVLTKALYAAMASGSLPSEFGNMFAKPSSYST